MEYNFRDIEKKWQQWWKEKQTYKVDNNSPKPKYYVLDMFPYPSGAGLHVGHPLGYIASDIYARYKRLKGFNVLHPMGYDAFGLPAEQYAIEHGIHPAISTAQNIENFRKQLDKIGFCFDWSREVNTSEPSYYKWTQWIFLQLFKSFYNRTTKKAESIESLVETFEKEGNENHPFPNQSFQLRSTVNGQRSTENTFTAEDWKGFTEKQQQDILMEYRLAYCGYGEVNWCEALGTVLANDEVVNGVSERGGYPVVKKKLRQWYLRITEYADRLLEGLRTVDFSEAMKEMQTNWIGKSYGAEINFRISDSEEKLKVFTTRPDTIFGVDFMVIAPEHELVSKITTEEQKKEVEDYLAWVKSRSDRERMAEKQVSGAFTGAYAFNPFDQRMIPIYVSEYVLIGYGTGAIMAVPCGDERDFKFAKHFDIPITNILGDKFNGEEANPTKDAELANSNFLTGMLMRDAIKVVMEDIEDLGYGKAKVNYKMRDAAFSRQRYWGEPFPIVWKPARLTNENEWKAGGDGIAYPLDENELPLELPNLQNIKPGKDGEGPLANLKDWIEVPASSVIDLTPNPSPKERDTLENLSRPFGRAGGEVALRESSTMPGYAGSSWYFLRYMDPHNDETFCDKKASDYWNQVDVYVGGTEHAVGHLLYSRMWTKFLFDLGLISFDEPYKKLLNQGMIQGSSRFVYRLNSKFAARIFSEISNSVLSNYKFEPVGGLFDEFNFVSNSEKLIVGLYHSYNLKNIDYEKAKDKTAPNLKIYFPVEYFFKYYFLNKEEFILNISNLVKERVSLHDKYSSDNDFFISKDIKDIIYSQEVDNLRVDVNIVDGVELDIEKFKQWRNGEYANAEFILEDGKYICGVETEKMSKSKFNTVDPSDLVEKYGADTFRMYEMFLGPVEQSKPWDTKGIEGVHRFLRKLWRLYYDEQKGKVWNEEKPTDAELKILHKAIKKIEEDTERFSFNTAVSAFMVCVNDLADIKCNKKEILEPLAIMLSSYAPHIAEELYHALGNETSVLDAAYPTLNSAYLIESTKEYPISINGKLRTTITLPLDINQKDAEEIVLQNDVVKKWLDGKSPKKIIFVKSKMVNVVI